MKMHLFKKAREPNVFWNPVKLCPRFGLSQHNPVKYNEGNYVVYMVFTWFSHGFPHGFYVPSLGIYANSGRTQRARQEFHRPWSGGIRSRGGAEGGEGPPLPFAYVRPDTCAERFPIHFSSVQFSKFSSVQPVSRCQLVRLSTVHFCWRHIWGHGGIVGSIDGGTEA